MALKLILKPSEKVIINQAVIVNGSHKSEIILQNKANVLRERDILTEEQANSPAKRVYFTVQMMYIFPENKNDHVDKFNVFSKQFLDAVPSSYDYIKDITEKVEKDDIYGALKKCHALVGYEKELIENAKQVS